MRKLIKKMVPEKMISFYHFLLALSGAMIYGFPSRRIKVVGITGTKGKTTTANFTAKILEEAGFNVALLSSAKFKIKDSEKRNSLKMTMPGRFFIQKFIKKALKAGCHYLVLEVTSEGIKQHRHRFINFDVAVFTNLSLEHIESHGSFEKYREAKLELFKKTKNIHIINGNDKNASYFLKIPAKKKIVFGEADDIREDLNGLAFRIRGVEFNLSSLGSFNAYNVLAAVSVALSQDIPLELSSKALCGAKTEGRMEVVLKEPLTVVDYAHTPASLEAVYKSLRSFKKNRMICVLGACGGGRDKWKRPVFGEIASNYCDNIIVTNEDPYDEDPMEIISQVAEKAGAEKIIDRREAIRRALLLAGKDDIVIITGKGSEPWMCVKNGKKIAWDDRKVVKEEAC